MTHKEQEIILMSSFLIMVSIFITILFLSSKDYKICDVMKNEYQWKVCFLNKDNEDECRIFDYFPTLSEGQSCIKFEEGGITQYFCGDYFKYEQILLDDNCSHLKK